MKDLEAKKVNRRKFLKTTGASAAATAIGFSVPSFLKSEKVDAAPHFTKTPFALGVASGDPLPDSVVLWTRLAPEPLAEDGSGGMDNQYFPVHWEIADDEGFKKIVRSGTEVAGPELGHSVHAEVFGLKAGREYFYRFKVGDETSPVGKTKTAPREDQQTKELTFAIASCQAWTGGRFAAYKNMVQEDLDFVLHLGDYIYEKGDTESLADYRLLHAQYKTSEDLKAAHAKFPFIVTFDDHEVDNDWSGDISDPNYPDGEQVRFLAVRAAAFQAYYEHMPLRRRSKPDGSDMLLYRKFSFGDLAEFSVLDTRQYRDNQVGKGFPAGPQDPEASSPERTLVGSEQGEWLLRNLHQSEAKWNVIAQQTIMAHYDYDPGEGISVNHDQWDGYSADRDRLFTFLKKRKPSNPVVLTGDWHSSWVNDLKEDFNNPSSKTLATEFVGTSISSGCGWKDKIEEALHVNSHVKFFDGDYRGYVRCHVTQKEWLSDFRVVSSPSNPDAEAVTIASFVVENGKPGARRVGGIDVSNITANTMIAGQASPVSVSLSNGTTKPVAVQVNIPVPSGWKSESVTMTLEPSATETVKVMITTPKSEPVAERLSIEVDAGKTTVFGPPRDFQVVSALSEEQTILALDAGGLETEVYDGYKALAPEDVWDPAKGYGWIGTAPFARDRGKSDALQRDLIASREEKIFFRISVPAGKHQFYLLTGDAVYSSANTIIRSDNKLLIETGNVLAPGQYKWLPFDLDGGSSGKEIDLEFSGESGDGAWRLVSLVMVQPS